MSVAKVLEDDGQVYVVALGLQVALGVELEEEDACTT